MVEYFCDLCGEKIKSNELKVDFEFDLKGQERSVYNFHIGCGKEAKELFEQSIAKSIEKGLI